VSEPKGVLDGRTCSQASDGGDYQTSCGERRESRDKKAACRCQLTIGGRRDSCENEPGPSDNGRFIDEVGDHLDDWGQDGRAPRR